MLIQPNYDTPGTTLEQPLFTETLAREKRLPQLPTTASFTRLLQPMREL